MKNRHFQGIGLVLIMGLSFCAAANGKTWHVSGETLADIKQQEQVKTIGQAAALAEPGDKVIIHSGIYREAVEIEKSGLSNNPITFRAAAGAGVIMTAPTSSANGPR
jgi:aspartate 1-decarboxylase